MAYPRLPDSLLDLEEASLRLWREEERLDPSLDEMRSETLALELYVGAALDGGDFEVERGVDVDGVPLVIGLSPSGGEG